MKEKFHFKPASKCDYYSSLDVSYIDNDCYYGASLGLVLNEFDNFGVPILALGLTYMTNGSQHELLGTVGLLGFRGGLGTRSDGELTSLVGYSITIKRMIFYLDIHFYYLEEEENEYNSYYYNSYYKSSAKSSGVNVGVNFGVGFLF